MSGVSSPDVVSTKEHKAESVAPGRKEVSSLGRFYHRDVLDGESVSLPATGVTTPVFPGSRQETGGETDRELTPVRTTSDRTL